MAILNIEHYHHSHQVLETSSFPVKLMALGILADLCAKPNCVPFLITWRKNGQRLLPMLMQIFRSETETPWCSKSVAKLEFVPPEIDQNYWSKLCSDIHSVQKNNIKITKYELLRNCRPKIYVVLCAIKEKFRDRVEIANEHYRLFNKKLNTDDQLTMLFAENYVSLKLCEAWKHVVQDLGRNKIEPTPEDSAHLSDKMKSIKQWKIYLQRTVEYFYKKDLQKEQINELEAYTSLKESRLSDALDALRDLRYISNCTERLFQMNKKIRQTQEIDSVQMSSPNYYRTSLNLPFTNIYNQCVSVKSNVIMPGESITEIEVLSSDDGGSIDFQDSKASLLINEGLDMSC